MDDDTIEATELLTWPHELPAGGAEAILADLRNLRREWYERGCTSKARRHGTVITVELRGPVHVVLDASAILREFREAIREAVNGLRRRDPDAEARRVASIEASIADSGELRLSCPRCGFRGRCPAREGNALIATRGAPPCLRCREGVLEVVQLNG